MYYNRSENCIELAVRELCALAYAGGSLDLRLPPKSPWARAAEGRDAHRDIQDGRGAGYHAEVFLRTVCKCGDVTFSVSGRADGVCADDDGGYLIEEIKSVTRDPAFYAVSPRETDLAQLACYGHILCETRQLSSVTLRLTYVRVGSADDEAHADAVMTAEHLRDLFVSMLALVLPRAADRVERETTFRDAAKSAVFPYPSMRGPQEDMIRECWRDMRAGQTLFAQAPTGIGKTMSALYPAVRCLGEDRFDKIFYLTAKNAARREAFKAAEHLSSAGTPIRACVITARESACLNEQALSTVRETGGRLSGHCNPEKCPYAKGYYDKVDSVISRMLHTGNGLFSGMTIREAAQKAGVCPYELSLDLSERCELVICDYNYVFSPNVYLRRYFSDGIPGTEGNRYVFLVDEAHNLPDRARDMYSGGLCLSGLTAVQDGMHAWETSATRGAYFPDEDVPLLSSTKNGTLTASALDDLIGTLTRMRERCRETMTTGSDGVRRGVDLDRSAPVLLTETAATLSAQLDSWLRTGSGHPLYGILDGLSSTLHGFLTAAAYYDERFVTFTEVEGGDDGEEVRVRLVCLDPAGILRPILRRASARVLFSATLTPADYFADILGGGKDAVTASFDSPFPPENLCVALADQVNTRFGEREKSYRRIVSYIAAAVSARPGNYMVYFPSYAYLEKVYELFHKKYPQVGTVVQTQGMTYAEREAFIASFKPDEERLRIGFCVLGGSFSEGVDLPGRCLIGAVIIGVGIPGLSNERGIMTEYYDETREGEGYAYAYTYPGMNHVLQAAGRVIRRPDDKGVVVLIDDRYMSAPYLRLYPAHWENMAAVGDPYSLAEQLRRFWDGRDAEKT